jgi:hypothetical protein
MRMEPAASKEREAREERGLPIADWLWPPAILPGCEVWLGAFHDLGTDRQLTDYGRGPIPHRSIQTHTAGWPEADAECFYHVIRALDRAFLDELTAQAEARAKVKA